MSPDLAALSEALKDIDPMKFPHGIEQYTRFGPKTVRAIIHVRDLVMHTPDLSETVFRIGITNNPQTQEATDRQAGCLRWQIIFESADPEEIQIVEADTRLNFLWHFPGRCLNITDYRIEVLPDKTAHFVYVACFPDGAFTIPGKA